MVDPGNLVKADETLLTTIVTQDPLYVYFDVHEQAMLRIRRLIEEGKLKAEVEKEVADPDQPRRTRRTRGGRTSPHQGVVDFTDNRVDLNTGTLRFRAKIDNPGEFITPGPLRQGSAADRRPPPRAHGPRAGARSPTRGRRSVRAPRRRTRTASPTTSRTRKGEPS